MTVKFERLHCAHACLCISQLDPQEIFCDNCISSLPGVRFSLRGTTYQNNSLVTLEDIGDNDTLALLCMTDLDACCRNPHSTAPIGDWFFPNGTGVPNSDIDGQGLMWEFYRNRGQSVVRMIRRRGGVDGIYRCEIPVSSVVNQTIYIGVYTTNTGEWYMFIGVN